MSMSDAPGKVLFENRTIDTSRNAVAYPDGLCTAWALAVRSALCASAPPATAGLVGGAETGHSYVDGSAAPARGGFAT